jgi:hypothetical protein
MVYVQKHLFFVNYLRPRQQKVPGNYSQGHSTAATGSFVEIQRYSGVRPACRKAKPRGIQFFDAKLYVVRPSYSEARSGLR